MRSPAGNRAGDGRNSGGHVLTRRPSGHAGTRVCAERCQRGAVTEQTAQIRGESLNVTTGEYIASHAPLNEVETSPNFVAKEHGQAAHHRFTHDDRARIVTGEAGQKGLRLSGSQGVGFGS
jgi:hypothetical protein